MNYFSDIGYERTYRYLIDLVERIHKDNPGSEIFVQSILPVSKEREISDGVSNEDIKRCNSLLEKASDDHDYTYIDLYSLYEKDGYLNDEYSGDGLHITNYSIWENKIRGYIYE